MLYVLRNQNDNTRQNVNRCEGGYFFDYSDPLTSRDGDRCRRQRKPPCHHPSRWWHSRRQFRAMTSQGESRSSADKVIVYRRRALTAPSVRSGKLRYCEDSPARCSSTTIAGSLVNEKLLVCREMRRATAMKKRKRDRLTYRAPLRRRQRRCLTSNRLI